MAAFLCQHVSTKVRFFQIGSAAKFMSCQHFRKLIRTKKKRQIHNVRKNAAQITSDFLRQKHQQVGQTFYVNQCYRYPAWLCHSLLLKMAQSK